MNISQEGSSPTDAREARRQKYSAARSAQLAVHRPRFRNPLTRRDVLDNPSNRRRVQGAVFGRVFARRFGFRPFARARSRPVQDQASFAGAHGEFVIETGRSYDADDLFQPGRDWTGEMAFFLRKLLFDRRVQERFAAHPQKMHVVMSCEGTDADGEPIFTTLRTRNTVVGSPRHYRELFQRALGAFLTFKDQSDGESYSHIIDVRTIRLVCNDYQALAGSSHMELPPTLKAKRAVVNVRNEDNKCFLWAVLSALHPQEKNAERVAKYQPYEGEVNKVHFPVSVDDIPAFEKKNPGLAVAAYEWTAENQIRPWRVPPAEEGRRLVQLLFLVDEATGNSHWMWIKNWNRLCSSKDRQCRCCPRCLCRFDSHKNMEEHQRRCASLAAGRCELAKPGSTIEFKACPQQARHPIIIYADFECVQDPTHAAVSFQLLICAPGTGLHNMKITRVGANASVVFFEELHKLEKRIMKHVLYADKPMRMTPADVVQFGAATCCMYCGDPFAVADKVRDHDHVTGKFRGAACRHCNLQVQLRKVVPVFLHNGKGYDFHLLLAALPSIDRTYRRMDGTVKERSLDGIAENSEKFKTFTYGMFRFSDSCAHLPSSLGKLLTNLPDGEKTQVRALASTEEQFQLINGKLPFPYEWFDDPTKLDGPIPRDRETYYSSLTLSWPSEAEMARLERLIVRFDLRTFRDLHDLYLSVDVAALADCFESYRALSLRTYGLDPALYLGTPGFGWAAMLKKSKVKFESIHDIDMYLFLEKAKRGGISVAALRHAKANNPEMLPPVPEKWRKDYSLVCQGRPSSAAFVDWCQQHDYDPQAQQSFILYLDANNLYGWAMSKKLPLRGFRWAGDRDIAAFDLFPSHNWDGDVACFLEVDLEYPPDVEHDMYPLAPEHLTIKEAMISPKSREYLVAAGSRFVESSKLVTHLGPRRSYVLHVKNLQFYVAHGMVLAAIHRVLFFHQDAYLEPYIRMNTELRAQARNDFEKDYYKLMNNAVFGKTMENTRNHVNSSFVTNGRCYSRKTARPAYRFTSHFGNESFRIIFSEKEVTKLDRPIYCGAAVLDLSKILMYEFHYDVILPLFKPPSVQLIFTDTDSLEYHIQIDSLDDFQRKLLSIRSDWLDTSNYPETHPLFSSKNKKQLGFFKNEHPDEAICEAVALRAKVHAELSRSGAEKRLKGIARAVVERAIDPRSFVACVLHGTPLRVDQTVLRSRAHEVATVSQSKLALQPYDDKRYILSDGVRTLAHRPQE